jgi:non-lysosomal glucosylceramidase
MVRVLQGFGCLCWLFTAAATPSSWFLLLTSGPTMWKFQMTLGMRLWSYVREEASHGRVTLHALTQVCFKHLGSKCCELMDWSLLLCLQKALIDPFTKERCKPSASQGVPLGGMGWVRLRSCFCFSNLLTWRRIFILISVDCLCRSGSISRGFRGEFNNWHIIPGLSESSPVMENQFSVMLPSYLVLIASQL